MAAPPPSACRPRQHAAPAAKPRLAARALPTSSSAMRPAQVRRPAPPPVTHHTLTTNRRVLAQAHRNPLHAHAQPNHHQRHPARRRLPQRHLLPRHRPPAPTGAPCLCHVRRRGVHTATKHPAAAHRSMESSAERETEWGTSAWGSDADDAWTTGSMTWCEGCLWGLWGLWGGLLLCGQQTKNNQKQPTRCMHRYGPEDELGSYNPLSSGLGAMN